MQFLLQQPCRALVLVTLRLRCSVGSSGRRVRSLTALQLQLEAAAAGARGTPCATARGHYKIDKLESYIVRCRDVAFPHITCELVKKGQIPTVADVRYVPSFKQNEFGSDVRVESTL